ncbi:MAG: bifunctional demethylmenaquinone methyltransferase/2-methoxy-6-polyprenyl-1,4-benzoquinol methylase UbiE [Bryobacterales bacterium]|nr:bifunctional demethylmenaquinone methyltransferase/2-methoxy-6-polyprenyl-1,4-benzoquinol methylase UbiE [Bryobacterales bacterium]
MALQAGKGTTPKGAATEEQAARYVRGMFDQVAPRYDLLNHVLSFQIDKYWRRRTVSRVQAILDQADARVLDLACGTGDLTLALTRAGRARVIGSDFCHPMLTAAAAKNARLLFEADALTLPVASESFDLVTCAFGFRNFVNYRRGMAEILRVLKPGGTAAILEFSTPPNRAFRAVYGFYSTQILPRVGALISGSKDAYTYLPESVRKFPEAAALAEEFREAGYAQVEYELLTFGIVALHLARKPACGKVVPGTTFPQG